jgi:hypothetical protein
MKSYINKLITFFGLFLTIYSLNAQDVYIRQGATGTGVDWNNALGALPATFTRGYTYYVADGSYGSKNFNTAASGTTLISIKKATVKSHGTEVGWNSTYGDGQAIFASPLQFTSSYWLFDGVDWQGFVLTCNGIAGGCPGCGSMYIPGDYVKIRGVKFDASYSAGFGHSVGLGGRDTIFDYCFFNKSTYEDIFGGNPKGLLTIRQSVITMPNIPNDGAHRDIWNPYTGGGWSLLFENNIVYNVWLFGMLLQDPSTEGTLTIRYNVFSTFGHATFRLGSGNGGTGNVTVYNNVFHNCLDLQIDSGKLTERNNIYSRTAGWLDMFGSSTVHAGGGNSQYNLYTAGTSSFQAGQGNINNADVKFINASSPLGADGIPFTDDDGFNIQAGSAAISAGVNVSLVNDIRGNSVPSIPSVGAYQFGTNNVIISNTSPTITLTSPLNNSTYSTMNNILLSANASDSDGSITNVDFYNNSTKIGSKSSSPYSLTWTSVSAGNYSIQAKAIDNLGAASSSSIANIIVTNPPASNGCTNYVTNTIYIDRVITNTVTQTVTNTIVNYITNSVIPDISSILGLVNQTNKTLDIKVNFN